MVEGHLGALVGEVHVENETRVLFSSCDGTVLFFARVVALGIHQDLVYHVSVISDLGIVNGMGGEDVTAEDHQKILVVLQSHIPQLVGGEAEREHGLSLFRETKLAVVFQIGMESDDGKMIGILTQNVIHPFDHVFRGVKVYGDEKIFDSADFHGLVGIDDGVFVVALDGAPVNVTLGIVFFADLGVLGIGIAEKSAASFELIGVKWCVEIVVHHIVVVIATAQRIGNSGVIELKDGFFCIFPFSR